MSFIEKGICFSTLSDNNDVIGIQYKSKNEGLIILTNKNRTITLQNVSFLKL